MNEFSLNIRHEFRFHGMKTRLRDYETVKPAPKSRSLEVPKSKEERT